MKIANDFLAYSILSVSSEDPDWLVESLQVSDSSTYSFRSLVTTEVTIVIDLLAATNEPRILLYNANFATFKIQGNTSDSWGAPSFDSGSLSIEKDPELRVYKRGYKITGFNYRYLRLVIPSQTPVDNASYFELGVLAVFASEYDYGATVEGFGLPVDDNLVIAEALNRSSENRKKIVPLSDLPIKEFRFSGNFSNSVATRQKLANSLGDPLKNLIFLQWESVNTWECYLVNRLGSLESSVQIPGESGVRSYVVQVETIL